MRNEIDSSVWWVRYRDSQAPRPRMNREMVLRSSAKAVVKEYMTNSSLSGVRYLVDKDKCKKERIFWLIVILAAGASILNILWMSWTDFVARPFIVSLESHNYHIKNIPFPAISLCNINRISKKAAEEYARKLHPVPNHTLDEVKQQIYRTGRLLDYEIEEYNQMLPFIKHIDSTPDPDGLGLVDRIRQLSPKCSELLTRCLWAGRKYNCTELFNFRRTVNGFCCNFNYLRVHNKQGHPYLLDDVKRQRAPGMLQGLVVIADPQLHDYSYTLHNAEGFDVILYDGTNYLDRGSGRVVSRILEPNYAVFLVLDSKSVEATAEVRKYSASTRGCRFRDELPEEYDGLYSYTACIVSCRIRAAQSLCKCIPFYMPISSRKSAMCTLFDVPCLDKYREKLLYMYPETRTGDAGLELELEDSLYCPECLPDCVYTHHTTRSFEFNLNIPNEDRFPYEAVAGVDMTNKSVLAVFHETSETTLYRMDVVYYWFELVSNLGGIAGVFVGYSIISVIEFFYFFLYRFYVIMRETTDKYYY